MNDHFIDREPRHNIPAPRRNFYMTMVVVAAVVTILLVGLFVSPPRRCVAVLDTSASSTALHCARFIDLPESEQIPSLCMPQIEGRCTTTSGVCGTFAFVNDTTVEARERGFIGQSYRCGNVGCTEFGSPCVCNQPLLYSATRFCRRANSTFACYSVSVNENLTMNE